MQRLWALSLLVGAFCFALPQTTDSQQQAQPQEKPKLSQGQQDIADLGAYKKAIQSDSGDLEAMAQNLHNTGRGNDAQTALAVDQRAIYGTMEVDSAIWFLALASNMECEKDRTAANAVLKNRLEFYSHLLDMQAGEIGPYLTFTKLPAITESGSHLRDQLRAAKSKMDEIAARL